MQDNYHHPFYRLLSRLRVLYSQMTLSEISGSMGDIGTLFPLLIGLARQRGVLLAPALFFGGLSNMLTGLAWDCPMCVQPMKSIAAVALAENLSAGFVTAAGILTGAMILILGIFGLVDVINAIVPESVVSGLQIGVGLNLAKKGVIMVNGLNWWGDGDSSDDGGYDCILTSVVLAMMCLFLFRGEGRELSKGVSDDGKDDDRCYDGENETDDNIDDRENHIRRGCLDHFFCAPFRKWRNNDRRRYNHPVGIYLFLIGAVFAAITLATTSNRDGRYDLPLRLFGAPVATLAVIRSVTSHDWKVGFFEGAVPQIPLTTLNSVISVCALAHNLYPERRKKCDSGTSGSERNDLVISRRDVAVSVGLMNLVFCPFGSMPYCHGAGGLAGQHRLGARHGASVFFLGVTKVILAVFFGASALTLLDAFPESVLGLMLVIAGQELTTTGFVLLVSSVENASKRSEDFDARNRMNEHERKRLLRQNTVIAVITATVIVSVGKTQYGALSGFVAHVIYGEGYDDFMSWVNKKRRRIREKDLSKSDHHVKSSNIIACHIATNDEEGVRPSVCHNDVDDNERKYSQDDILTSLDRSSLFMPNIS